ncbi:MAG: pirin family protein [Candidatus Gracilibacteria bacterium]|nr:pirin family protein [Candidatus Gracilibacteria bacterium]
MTQTVLHRADTRGHANHGWLDTHHSFSFADYYDSSRMGFGALRVLNDDIIAPGMGFGTHPHADMEIITIPLEGDLEHRDSMGNGTIIKSGDIQVMSAGTGIRHSEFNPNRDKYTNLLQIWIIPNTTGATPRYDQITLVPKHSENTFEQIISPNPEGAGIWIHQDAWFHIGKFDSGKTIEYSFKKPANGLYIFVISGSLEIENITLETRDGIGIWDTNHISMKMLANSRILLMEVPMR